MVRRERGAMKKGFIIISLRDKKQPNISLKKCPCHYHYRTALFTANNGSNAAYIITLSKYTTFLNHPSHKMIHEGCATRACLFLGFDCLEDFYKHMKQSF